MRREQANNRFTKVNKTIKKRIKQEKRKKMSNNCKKEL